MSSRPTTRATATSSCSGMSTSPTSIWRRSSSSVSPSWPGGDGGGAAAGARRRLRRGRARAPPRRRARAHRRGVRQDCLTMRTLKLVLEYDGTDYHGWQVQATGPTIQGVLEEKLAVVLREPVRVMGSGRTDAGVHALMQVASFRTASDVAPETLQRALNALLPRDIAVR